MMGHQYHERIRIESVFSFLSLVFFLFCLLFSCLVAHRLCGEESRVVGLFKSSIAFNKNELEMEGKNLLGVFP